MAIEIERKFLVKNDLWRSAILRSESFRQGYLTQSGPASVRVRVEGDRAFLNIKSATLGIRRSEYEYEIPLADAREMLENLCGGMTVEKTRYFVQNAGNLWEIDVFEGQNAGLVVAEVELQDEFETVELPAWADIEVSDDPRYYNVNLTKHPYTNW